MDMTNKNQTKTKREVNSCVECGCVCFACIFLLGLIGLAITSFVVWIIALVNGKNLDINENCPNNELWEWLLVWGIITYIGICSGASSKKNDNNSNDDDNKCFVDCCKICCSFIVIIGHITLCWWGRQQLEHNDWCLDKTYGDTIFYKTSYIFWWLEFIILCAICGLLGILFIGFTIYLMLLNCSCGRKLLNKEEAKINLENINNDLIKDIDIEYDNATNNSLNNSLEV